MANINCFEDLECWRLSREIVNSIYSLTKKPPFSGDYGLQNQIQRAAVSAMSNIAEGFERGGNKEFRQFLSIAKGSAGEVKSLLYIASDLGYMQAKTADELREKIDKNSRMISGLLQYLNKCNYRGPKYGKTRTP